MELFEIDYYGFVVGFIIFINLNLVYCVNFK